MPNQSTPHPGRALGGLLLALLALAFPMAAAAQGATISLDLVGSPSLEEGTNFQVRVYTSANDTGTTPSGANLRLTFDSAFVEPIADDPGALPDPIYGITSGDGYLVAKGAIQGASPDNHVNLTVACPENTGMTPELCVVEFTVIQAGVFSIGLVADDRPSVSSPFLNVRVEEIPIVPFIQVITTPVEPLTLDATATQDLEAVTDVGDWIMFEY